MIAIISPALTMKECRENYIDLTIPCQINKAKEIVEKIKTLSKEELKEIMGVNDKIAELNKLRYEHIKYDEYGTPAIISYTGTAYKSINASVFNKDEIEFCKNHIRILSGLYGVLKPYDSVYEHRLEMKTKISINNSKDLYDYFGRSLYNELVKEDREIINLCSEEYSKAITPYLKDEDKFITCSFKIYKNGSLKSYSTDAKSTRGLMVRYIVENKIDNKEFLKDFKENGYTFNESLSTEIEYIFTK